MSILCRNALYMLLKCYTFCCEKYYILFYNATIVILEQRIINVETRFRFYSSCTTNVLATLSDIRLPSSSISTIKGSIIKPMKATLHSNEVISCRIAERAYVQGIPSSRLMTRIPISRFPKLCPFFMPSFIKGQISGGMQRRMLMK